MKQIAVVGRLLNNVKWNALFEILEEARAEEVLEYTSYSVDNGKKYTEIECDAYIYLATKRMFEDDKPWIRFTDKAEGDDFINQITELNEKLFGEENGRSTDQLDIPSMDNNPTIDITDTSLETVCNEEIVIPKESLEDIHKELGFPLNTVLTSTSVTGLAIIPSDYSPHLKECVETQSLVGILIEINGRDVCLHKDDAFKLRELMEFSKEFGFKVKDVVTS